MGDAFFIFLPAPPMRYNMQMENRTDEISDILYSELKMRQPDERAGPRVNVDTVLLADFELKETK